MSIQKQIEAAELEFNDLKLAFDDWKMNAKSDPGKAWSSRLLMRNCFENLYSKAETAETAARYAVNERGGV